MRFTKLLLVTALFSTLLIFVTCTSKSTAKKYPTNKLAPNDPFAATMTESQFFEIDAAQDNIIEGAEGTVIAIPEGALLNKNGKPAKGKVKFELTEVFGAGDMLFSNLTTTANGKLLQSGGMLYINATANGEELRVDPKKPLQINIPTQNKINGMMAYRGIRDTAGNMNWVDPIPLVKYLTTVPLDELDFLPERFYNTVAEGMPYRGHLQADRKLADSLYSSLAVNDGKHLTDSHENTNLNEAHHNKHKEIKNKKYTEKSFEIRNREGKQDSIRISDSITDTNILNCKGINPASIKVIKGEKFANSFIATREFEKRMVHIHHSCLQPVLETYINNLDKNLWEADSMAYMLLKAGDNQETHLFKDFYNEKLGKVKDGDKMAKKLAEYYATRLKNATAELEKIKKLEIRKLEKETEEVIKVKKKYTEVLWKREKTRMQKYNVEWTDMGWLNIDTGVVPKDCPTAAKLEVVLADNNTFDRVYVYTLLTSIKSLYRLNTEDNKNYYAGNPEDKTLDMPCDERSYLIAIGYKGKQLFFTQTLFYASRDNKITMKELLQEVTQNDLTKLLNQYQGDYSQSNSIAEDLIYQEKFYKEEQRQKVLRNEQEFIFKLRELIYPCCPPTNGGTEALLLGKTLFEDNCSSCHNLNTRSVGPSLAGVRRRRTEEWIIKFTRNSQGLIAAGDPLAVQLYEENLKQAMSSFENLSDDQIKAIYSYVDPVMCNSQTLPSTPMNQAQQAPGDYFSE